MPAFELGDVAFGDTGIARQQLARHAAPGPGFAHPIADPPQITGIADIAFPLAQRQTHFDILLNGNIILYNTFLYHNMHYNASNE